MPTRQKDGRYRSKLVIGHDPDGKPIVKWAQGKTKKELEENKAALKTHYITGSAASNDVLFGVYALKWYKTMKAPHISVGSEFNYTIYMNKHISPVFGLRNLRSIRPMEIQTWLNSYAGKSKTTINYLLAVMRGVFKSALAEGIVYRDPTAGLVRPKVSQAKPRRALTQDERCAVVNAAASNKEGALLALMYYLGVRRGEALGLMWSDINWDANIIRIERDIDNKNHSMAGDVKTGSARREIPIDSKLRAILEPLSHGAEGYIIKSRDGKPLSESSFRRMWIRLMIDCGFATAVPKPPESRKSRDITAKWRCEITAHYLRHDYATRLYEAGIDIPTAMRLLGHADYNTTVKVYTHISKEKLRQAGQSVESARVKKIVARKLPKSRSTRTARKANPPKT